MIASSRTYSRPAEVPGLLRRRGHDHVAVGVVPPRQPALGDLGAAAGRGEERRDPRAARAHPLGQRALRGQLDLELAGEVLPRELLVLPDVGRDHPPQPLLGQQPAQPPVVDTAVVRDRLEVGRARPPAARRSAPTGSRTARTRPPTASRRPGCPRPPRPHLPQPCPRDTSGRDPATVGVPEVTPGARRSPRLRSTHACPACRIAAPLEQTDSDLPGVQLHVVTGKGGTGKTTVAAALALALASRGKTVLLCEVEGRQGIAQLFDVPPLPYEERLIARGAPTGGPATSTRWRSTRSRRCWSTSTCTTASAAPARRSTGSASSSSPPRSRPAYATCC